MQRCPQLVKTYPKELIIPNEANEVHQHPITTSQAFMPPSENLWTICGVFSSMTLWASSRAETVSGSDPEFNVAEFRAACGAVDWDDMLLMSLE